jgi:cobalt/nickel transport system permease protein
MKPGWLVTTEDNENCPHFTKKNRKSFLEKTLKAINYFFRDGILSEEYANRKGMLQQIDPRVKIVSFVSLIVVVSLLRSPFLITGLYIFVLLLAVLSKISLKFFIPRVWLFIPLFSGIIAIPAMFNVVVPGDPLLVIKQLDSQRSFGPFVIDSIYITRQGALAASVFVMRVATSVSSVILLMLTTRWPHLLKALRVLLMPQGFTFIIGMTHRYINLLLKMMEDIHLAKRSRNIKKISLRSDQNWVASQVGILLKRSLKLNEDVFSSMISRGYTKDVKIIDTFRIGIADFLWSGFFIILIASALGLNRLLG